MEEKTVEWSGSFAWPSEKEKKEEERISRKVEKQFFDKLKKAETVEFVAENGKRYKYKLKSMKRVGNEAVMTIGKAIKGE